jgi:ferric-dicitrate binding protein FerR (iron transport regulator)
LSENPDYIWFLLSRHINGEATPTEIAALQKWLAEDPGHQQQFELLKQLWQAKEQDPQPGIDASRINRILQLAAVEEVLKDKSEWMPAPSRSGKLTNWKVAATLVILALLAWAALYWITQADAAEKMHRIATPKGSRTRTILPDGSLVWLNAGSAISYDESFNQQRELTLEGEAYFDVTGQPGKSFTVHAGSIQVDASSASFNLKFYPEDTIIETTLIRGNARVLANDGNQSAQLQAYQKIILPSAGKPLMQFRNRIQEIDTSLKESERLETSWIFNRLEFRNDDFVTLSRKLERWYNITVRFEDENVKRLVFSGSVETESVQQALRALQSVSSFRYRISGTAISIGSSK